VFHSHEWNSKTENCFSPYLRYQVCIKFRARLRERLQIAAGLRPVIKLAICGCRPMAGKKLINCCEIGVPLSCMEQQSVP
jgi:hypothetical protein